MNQDSKRPFGELRGATPEDAKEMLAIYAPYVEGSVISFEFNTPSEEEFKQRIQQTLPTAPWLVYVVEGEIAGYAYAARHRERAAYQWAANVSVYVKANYQRMGIGRFLYESLFKALTEMGYYHAFGGITMPNDASVKLHESLGFTLVGTYKNVGYKCGAWHDVSWWQKTLRSTEEPPKPLLTFRRSNV
jgi:phosphinothricin acetyltransferase